MKNILIICDNINEITRLRKLFGEDFKVSGSNSPENALDVMQNRLLDLVIFQVPADMNRLFAFYKAVRQESKTERLPLVFVTDEAMLNVLNEVTALENAVMIAAPVTAEAVRSVINSFFADI